MHREAKVWTQALITRGRKLWLHKALATMGGIAAFFYGYFWVMRHPFSEVTVMPLMGLDEWIVFWPPSFLLYVSLWLYVALGSAFLEDRRELAAWASASLGMIAIGLGVFLVFPTRIPDSGIDWFRYPSLHFLKTVDVSGNACPSLHVAFAAFSTVVLHRTLDAIHAPRALIASNVLWGSGIVYSTIATRQHVVLDVAAGLALAAAGAVAFAWLRGRAPGRERRHLEAGAGH